MKTITNKNSSPCGKNEGSKSIFYQNSKKYAAILMLFAAFVFTPFCTDAQFMQQGSKLSGTDYYRPHSFVDILQGWAVSLSADGNTAAVGAYGDSLGAVRIYTRSGGVWSQSGAKLLGTNEVVGCCGVTFGAAVALSGDGNTLAVGGPSDNGDIGAIWIFTRNNITGLWSQQGNKLSGTGSLNTVASQGSSVALSYDGNTMVEGGTTDNQTAGAVWVWTRSGTTWSQQGNKLVGSGAIYFGAAPAQGTSVSMSADGNTFIEGAPGDNSYTGAAWIFTRSGVNWSQVTQLVGTGAVTGQNVNGASQGYSVAISADASTAIVGGSTDNFNHGAAWVYKFDGANWNQQGNKLTGTGCGGFLNQGTSVSLSYSGDTAIVGGNGDNNGYGAMWEFTRSANVWSQQGNKFSGNGVANVSISHGSHQARSEAIDYAGTTVFEGGYGDENDLGAAWAFVPCTGSVGASTPTVSVNRSSICLFSSDTLNITGGSLNDASDWQWYSDSCGCSGTNVGTGASIKISPLGTTTYYARGEGGCVAPGICGSGITITVNPNSDWFQDADGDGLGNPSVSINTCTQPAGYVSNSNDCDDTNPLIGVATLWYLDNDGDGFGNPNVSVTSCTQPGGYVADNTDCDDTNPALHNTCCIVNIPDANFLNALLAIPGLDANSNGQIECSEAAAYTGEINVFNANISDLTGIAAFTALTSLNCGDNHLTSLDVTQNTALTYLDCEVNMIGASLDLSHNTALTHLNCDDNWLTGILDISNNSALTFIDCGNNFEGGLTVDFTHNTALDTIYSGNINTISIDVSQNPALIYLDASSNLYLSSLNIANGNNAQLGYFYANNCPALSCIQVDNVAYANATWTAGNGNIDATESFSTNCAALCVVTIPDANFLARLISLGVDLNSDGQIQCSEATAFTGNMVVSNDNIADLTGIQAFTNITYLDCSQNSLTSLDVAQNTLLTYLDCSNNSLSSLDVSHNTMLSILNCYYNHTISSLNLSNNTALTYLDVHENALTSLNVSTNTVLTELDCSSNFITALDVTNNIALYYLGFAANQLTSIDLSQNLGLIYLWADLNSLTSLDVHLNTTLGELECYQNSLTTLNAANGANNGMTFSAFGNPNLTCIQVDNVAYSTANWTVANGQIDPTASFSTNCGVACIPTTWYQDNDGDGFGNPAVTLSACIQPAGYVADNTDCNDNDLTVHTTFSFYADADGDGFGAGGLVSVCAVDANTPPLGYSLNNTDCNDADNTIWQSASLYIDVDGDGYDNGTATVCYGATAPAGYSLTTSGSDCNDNNPAIHTSFSFYVDADGDGFGAGGSVSVCAVDANTPPVGYSLNNTDCAPLDNTKWQSALLYIDVDGDGYDNGTTTICYGATVPLGYSLTTLGSDCNDNNASIHSTSTIVASAGANGSISPNGTSNFCGGNQIYTITPSGGYAIASVTVDGNNVGTNSTYAFNSIAANHTIGATFISLSCTSAPAPPTMGGPSGFCGIVHPVFTAASTGAVSYTWTVPAGVTAFTGQGTSSITTTISTTSSGSGILTLTCTATNACGTSSASNFQTARKPLPSGPIGGPVVAVCANTSGITYSVAPVFGATAYQWLLPAGMTGTSTTNSITANTTATFAGGTITCIPQNACGSSSPATTLIVNSKQEPGLITGNSIICGTTTQSYLIVPVTGATSYLWGVATGMVITSGQGSTGITASVPTANNGYIPGGQSVKVAAINTCGTSAFRVLAIGACASPIGLSNSIVDVTANNYSEIYPNPTTQEFSIDITTDADRNITMEVYDILGNIVVRQSHSITSGIVNTMKTNIEQYKDGMYFVRLTDENGNVLNTQRVIKN